MQITFDPNDPDDVKHVMRFFGDPVSVTEPASETVTMQAVAADTGVPTLIDPAAGVELDKNGTPWLDDVHAGTKALNADGTWRKKRGTDDDIVAAAEKAARDKIAGTPAAPDLPPVEVASETVDPISYADLVGLYAEKHEAGLIDSVGFTALYGQYNTSNADLATNETARAAIYAHLEGLTESTGLPV